MAGEQGGGSGGIVLNYNNGSAGSVAYENNDIFPDYFVPFGSSVRPTGLSFLKWNTASDGSGVDGVVGETIPAADLENHTVYYAQWDTVPMIINKGRIEDIADAVRLKKQGSYAYTKFDLDDLPTAITSLKTNANIGIKTQLTGHRRLYGTSTSTNTLTLATNILNIRTYIGLFNWCVEVNDQNNYETLFVIENGTISYPFGGNGSSYGGYILTLSNGVLKIKANSVCCLIGLEKNGRAYNQYNTTDVVFRLYEAQTV